MRLDLFTHKPFHPPMTLQVMDIIHKVSSNKEAERSCPD